MWAIKHNFDMAEAAVMALRAGADVLLADDPAITYDALLHAIRTGDISLQRLDEAVLRVLELKEWLGLHEQRYVDVNAVSAVVGADEHREVAVNVARAGITMLRNENDIVPLGADARIFAIAPPSHRYTGESPTRTLLSLLCNAFVRAETTEISENPTDDEISQVRNRARALQPDAIVFATFARAEAYREESSQIATEMVELVRELSKLAPVIALSCGSPYALMRFDDAGVWLCAYSDCDASIQAVVEVLAGRLAPTGAVPVQL
ncbi:MAG TPA: hypothetical protein EYP10_14710, partial [Armatimonadetes bacterium]|nr:hypothetical protein [Armatimonadota bacterium]